MNAESLSNFVRQQAEPRQGAGRSTPGAVVRSFIRFLGFLGELDPALSGAIPTVRRSTHAALPKRLSTSDVEQILLAVRQSGLSDAIRDYAILLMLSQLGMWSCEIANLRLDDVDWSGGQVLVRPGKTHEERALPLSQEVGKALADYVQHTRAQSTNRTVFLKGCPPFTPFTSAAAIGHIAKRAMRKGGITVHRGMGAHTFRHTVASEMVNRGATFKDVADVLGHRSLETTGIYAKLDLNSLLDVAMPWTGEALLKAHEPATEIPDHSLLRGRRRAKPFLFTQEQVRALRQAAMEARPRKTLRPRTLTVLLGLLACTGLRIGEARRLRTIDVYLDHQPPHLMVYRSKFDKSRLVPLHRTTAAELRDYLDLRTAMGYDGCCENVFVSEQGGPLNHNALCKWFCRLCKKHQIWPTDDRRSPSLHSLRHYLPFLSMSGDIELTAQSAGRVEPVPNKTGRLPPT